MQNDVREWFVADPPRLLPQCCIFLDLDGMLVDFSDDPTEANVGAELTALLQVVATRLDGALALVSGRSLATLDVMLAPLRLPASGIFGLERRDAVGQQHRQVASTAALNLARGILADFVAACPGLIVEDKGIALALHFRRAPTYGADCRRIAEAAAAELGPRFHVVEGSMVVEIKPTGTSKATAIEEFLLEPPFADRVPIALGDDLSDCDAFSAVQRHGGLAVAVGRRITGDFRLEDWQAARHWLSTLVGVHHV